MKYIVSILLLFFPVRIVKIICKLFHCNNTIIGKNVKIGFSLIFADKIQLADNSCIGHLNFIKCKQMLMGGGNIGHLNFIKGDFTIEMEMNSRIGNQNKISSLGNSYHNVKLLLKKYASINTRHLLDMTDSISIGEGTTLAGADSQIWTHGFYFSNTSLKKARIDAPVKIGNHCYIGARYTILSNVTVANGITVGANCCVSKSLFQQGLYVSQSLRFIEFNPDEKISKLGQPICDDFIYKK